MIGLAPADVTTAIAADLRRQLAKHGVLVLRRFDIDDGGFVDVLRRLGRMTFTKGETPVDGHPELNLISNSGRTRPPRSTFHTDTSYVSDPPAYTALRAVTLPDRGGATLFSNQYRAFDQLPETLRRQTADRRVRHVVTGIAPGVLDDTDQQWAEHPLQLPHPRSGRTALYLTTPRRCAAVSGLNDAEGASLIAALYEHSTAPGNVYRHEWQAGDVVVWDNRCVMHRADHDGVVGDRVLHRGVVLDDSDADRNRPS